MNALPDLEALRRNESPAWDVLFDWLSPVARKSARLQLLGYPEEDVEEVAGDAILGLVEKVQEVQAVEELLPFVVRIAKCLGADRRKREGAKKRGRRLESSLEQLLEQSGDAGIPPSSNRPDQEVQRRERLSSLGQLLQKLKPPIMQLLIGFYILGQSYEELGRQHHLAIGSIGVYLNRGIEKLRGEIAQTPGASEALKIVTALVAHIMTYLLKYS